MKALDTGSVYSYTLTEDEWYSGTEQQREAWINQILREGVNAKYLVILVKPDSVMSVSPEKAQHRVWSHTRPDAKADEMYDDLMIVIEQYVGGIRVGALTMDEARAVARKAFRL